MKNFEQEWRNKMLNSQVSPSELVWENIAQELAQNNQKVRAINKRQWIALAVLVFLPLILGDGRFVWLFVGETYQRFAYKKNETTRTNDISLLTNTTQNIGKTIKKINKNNFLTQNPPSEAIFFAKASYELGEKEEHTNLLKKDTPLLAQHKLGKPKMRRWRLGQNFTALQNFSTFEYTPTLQEPALSGRVMLADNSTAQKDKNIQKELDSYRHLFSWRAGIDFQYQFHPNFYISSGLYYQQNIASLKSFSTQPAPLISGYSENPPIASENNYTNLLNSNIEANQAKPLSQEKTYFQRGSYLQIPLKIGFQKEKNKWRYGVALGTEASFLLSNNFAQEGSSVKVDAKQNLQNVQWLALSELSLGYRVGAKTWLNINPQFRKNFVPSLQNSAFTQKNLFSIGIGAGLQYNF
ncbi:MAG: hypothetical protein SFU27_04505 [Thermonemataceae bacterium]|nr:hypothetical protein [Thermonemataceae bacterium]